MHDWEMYMWAALNYSIRSKRSLDVLLWLGWDLQPWRPKGLQCWGQWLLILLPCCFQPLHLGQVHWLQWGSIRKIEEDFSMICHLAISFAICWIINTGQFMVYIAFCHSRKRSFPATLKLQHYPPSPYPTPALALPCWHLKYCWMGSAHTVSVWRRCTGVLNTFPFWITGNCLRNWGGIQSCKLGNRLSNPDTPCDSWVDWLKSGHLSCPSSSCRSISLHCRRAKGA